MQSYIGVKLVDAKPMTLGDYNQYRGWTIPSDEDPQKEGYLVQYEDGYESWCPKENFETHNRPTTGMPFGHAIEAARAGKKIARLGWNGVGIFLELQSPDAHSKMTHPYLFIDTTGLLTDNPDAPKDRVPWLASQTDMLSDDWFIVE